MAVAEDGGLSAEDLALLTDEEREAFADDDTEGEAQGDPSKAETEGSVAALDSKSEEDDIPDTEEETTADTEEETTADTEEETTAEASEQANSNEPFVPQYQADAVEGYQEKMTDIDTRRAALMADLMDGEIEQDVYAQQLTALEAERDALREANLKASIAQEQQAQIAQQRWQWEIENFLNDANANGGVDYKGNQMLFAALDTAVKQLGNDPANADKDARWFLQEGHKAVAESFQLTNAAESTTNKPKAATGVKQPVDIPPTLGGLPAAAVSATGEDRFAHLDRLEGVEYEEAIAKLSPADAEAYANA